MKVLMSGGDISSYSCCLCGIFCFGACVVHMRMHIGVHVHAHACACVPVLAFVVFLMLICDLTFDEWIFGSLFAVSPTCQAVNQLNAVWYLVLGPLCVEV